MRNLVALILPTGSLNAAGGTAANAQGQPSFAQVVFLAASATGARSLCLFGGSTQPADDARLHRAERGNLRERLQ